ncbi:MAG: ABC transporter permease [Planctomycetota bacterium]|nr:ABC transporter permease [Planctomycetota bacterium]
MNLWNTIRIALRSLAKNRMRAALTTLGVVIGIAAVMAMVSIGQSATGLVRGELEGLGTNVIIVFPKMRERRGVQSNRSVTLTAEDAEALRRECPSVAASSGLVGFGSQVVYGGVNWQPKESLGVAPSYLTVRSWELRRGGFFGEREIRSAEKVCVIGQTLVAKLFQTIDPIGEKIRIGNTPFRVIGVLEAKGANMVGEDQDDVLLVPYTAVQKRIFGNQFKSVNAIMASARTPELTPMATTEIRQLLRERHDIAPGRPADFEVQSTTEIANVLGVITGSMTAMLASIAAISLGVGGVGIMNIMLVSVTERTREIGVRMAVGARGRDILRQFLIEAVVLSVMGGTIGLLLGIGGSVGVIKLINAWSPGTDWPVVVSFPAAATAIGFSAAVGIFFGFYPARKASRLDPIEALRYE